MPVTSSARQDEHVGPYRLLAELGDAVAHLPPIELERRLAGDDAAEAHEALGQLGEIAILFGGLRTATAVAIEPGHDAWVMGDEAAVLIEVDFENDTVSRFGLPSSHRHD